MEKYWDGKGTPQVGQILAEYIYQNCWDKRTVEYFNRGLIVTKDKNGNVYSRDWDKNCFRRALTEAEEEAFLKKEEIVQQMINAWAGFTGKSIQNATTNWHEDDQLAMGFVYDAIKNGDIKIERLTF